MYTTKVDEHSRWAIYTPEGVYLCSVDNYIVASVLLSHLNR